MPLMMEASGLIDALIGVCTEIVALCLDEVRAYVLAAIAVEVLQCAGKGRYGDAC